MITNPENEVQIPDAMSAWDVVGSFDVPTISVTVKTTASTVTLPVPAKPVTRKASSSTKVRKPAGPFTERLLRIGRLLGGRHKFAHYFGRKGADSVTRVVNGGRANVKFVLGLNRIEREYAFELELQDIREKLRKAKLVRERKALDKEYDRVAAEIRYQSCKRYRPEDLNPLGQNSAISTENPFVDATGAPRRILYPGLEGRLPRSETVRDWFKRVDARRSQNPAGGFPGATSGGRS